MRKILMKAFKETVEELRAETVTMPLPRWGESVFRFLYSRAVAKHAPDIRQFFECNQIDLVLHHNSMRALMEFKFYVQAKRYDEWSGEIIGRKGCASKKNWEEFVSSVDKLKHRRARPQEFTVLKLVALFYADPTNSNLQPYSAFYGGIAQDKELNLKQLVSIEFELKNPADGRTDICAAGLYEVGT